MTYIPKALRRFVRTRTDHCCEYCRFREDATLFSFEMEHIVSEKHGGETAKGNLALACPYCNRFKGTDLVSIDPETGLLTPFFNPRQQIWADHFALLGNGTIQPLTAEGRVTAIILQFNEPSRVDERHRLQQIGMYL
jgi:hypothetical protein